MDALTKSLNRSLAVVNTAYEQALQLKAAGMLDVPAADMFGAYRDQGANRERYGLNRGWLYAAINALASEAAGQAVSVMKMTGRKKSERSVPSSSKAWLCQKMTSGARSKSRHEELEVLSDHPITTLLEKPNPIQHRWQFVYSFVANLNLTGWAYIVAEDAEDGLRLYSLPTTWVQPDHAEGPFSRFRVVNPRNRANQDPTEWIPRENVIMAYLPNPADPLGALSPCQTQVEAVRIDDYIQTSQQRFFENGIFPGVIVTVGKDPHPDVPGGIRPRLTAPQRRGVIAAIRKSMGGVANYGNPAIIDGLIESIERLSATQNEMGWEKSEGTVKTRILSAFGVHPFILGEALSVGGYAQAAAIYERFCSRINTYLDMLGTVLTEFFVNRQAAEPRGKAIGSDERILIWWERAEPLDPQMRWQNLLAARRNEDITRNELRAELNFPPVEEEQGGKSKMLETVAGMTGAVQIFTAVGQGMMSPSSAAQLLSIFFAIPLARAKAIVGGTEAKTEAEVEAEALEDAGEELRQAVLALKTMPSEFADKIARLSRLPHCEHESKVTVVHPSGQVVEHGPSGRFGSGGGAPGSSGDDGDYVMGPDGGIVWVPSGGQAPQPIATPPKPAEPPASPPPAPPAEPEATSVAPTPPKPKKPPKKPEPKPSEATEVEASIPGVAKVSADGFRTAADKERLAKTTAQLQETHQSLVDRFDGMKKVPEIREVILENKHGVTVEGKHERSTMGLHYREEGGSKIRLAADEAYSARADELTMGSYNAVSGVAGIYRHELGHSVYHGSPKSQQAAWDKLYAADERQMTGMMSQISSYAAGSSGEAFAESFAVYTHSNYRGTLPKPVHEYFDKLMKPKKKKKEWDDA